MKRKIVQHGSSSLTITLPVKWAEKFKLKKGDELDVEELGPELIVSTKQEYASHKKEVSTTDYGIFTQNNLSHLYQLGYDEIEIMFEDSKTLDEIKKRLPECIGYEIIDQKENKVYIKSIATTLDSEFDTLLRKSFQITNEMAKSIVEAVEKQQFQKLKEIRNMETLNNRFTDVCIRILNKRGYKLPKRNMQIYDVLKNIERIADEFKYLCGLLSDSRKGMEKELIESLKLAVDYYLTFYEIFYKFNSEHKKKLYIKRKELIERFIRQMEMTKGQNSVFIHHLINIVQKTYDASGSYFALML